MNKAGKCSASWLGRLDTPASGGREHHSIFDDPAVHVVRFPR